MHVSKHPSVTLFFRGINFLPVLNIILQSHQRCENVAVKLSGNVSQAHRGLNDTRVFSPRSQKEQVLLDKENFYGNGEKLRYSCLSSDLLICSSLWLAQSLSLFLDMGRANLLTIQPSTQQYRSGPNAFWLAGILAKKLGVCNVCSVLNEAED